ncbi:MAG: DUF1858 domain-containing protein [Lachnospiraceae bacterium]|jgi:hybrid cluster-associated redox disulfide protein
MSETYKVTKDTQIMDLIKHDITVIRVLVAAGMHCVGCPVSMNESIGEAAAVHRLNADALVAEINDYLAENHSAEASGAKAQ